LIKRANFVVIESRGDIQPGEIVEWKVDTRYKLFLIRQRSKRKKRKKP
jgi:hypothetical protein